MCFEQPDRERSALAALGAAVALEDRGAAALRAHRCALARARRAGARRRRRRAARQRPRRLRRLRVRARRRRRAALVARSRRRRWSSREVDARALAATEVWCTVAVAAAAGRRRRRAARARRARASRSLRERPLPLLDPHPTERHTIAGAMAPEHYEAAVARAVELIAAGRLEKIVLAREVDVHAPARARRRGGLRRAARGLRRLLRLRRRPRRRHLHRRDARSSCCAASGLRVSTRRARRLDRAQRRPGRRRPPRRAAAALGQGPRGARDRRAADRARRCARTRSG